MRFPKAIVMDTKRKTSCDRKTLRLGFDFPYGNKTSSGKSMAEF